MRKIESNMLSAVRGKKDWKEANTAVFYISALESGNPFGARSEVVLHGNHIADFWHESGTLEVDTNTLRRYPTNTTKSRLRALGANITTKAGVTYIDGVPI